MTDESIKGHAAHTKSAELKGLPGTMRRPIKVTMLGAGSGFTPTIIRDILQIPRNNHGGSFALVDIDKARLETMTKVIGAMLVEHEANGGAKWSVVGTTERSEILAGTDYIVVCVEVSGLACVRHDNDIPAKYGINQCIGDTIGPGGLFKALRTVPVFLDILRDAEKLCPKAIVLNYTNPMNIMCLAAGRAVPSMQVVGLCHSVQGTSHLLAKRAGVPYDEMVWECAGINHLAWFTKLEHHGRDLYPLLKSKAKDDIAGNPSDENDAKDLVRKDMMLQFGAFNTESSGHLSEYLPYYRKRGDIMDDYCRDGYDGGSSFYANNWPTWRANADSHRMKLVSGEEKTSWERSWEYGSWIIEACEKDVPYRIHGNVMNKIASDQSGAGGLLISNLPADGCVEVACLVDQNGIQPTRYGCLPAQMAAICDSNMWMFDLAATACIERSIEAATHALMLDPLTAAVCSLQEIRDMSRELFETESEFLPGFK
jgi:alpha-galactosidase